MKADACNEGKKTAELKNFHPAEDEKSLNLKNCRLLSQKQIRKDREGKGNTYYYLKPEKLTQLSKVKGMEKLKEPHTSLYPIFVATKYLTSEQEPGFSIWAYRQNF